MYKTGGHPRVCLHIFQRGLAPNRRTVSPPAPLSEPPTLNLAFSSPSEPESRAGAAGSGPAGGPDFTQSHFSSSLPTYLPVQCQLSGAETAFFLREANQEVMRNGSLSSRTEPFFLRQLEPGVANPHTLPTVNCSYGNASVEQPIPVELLQGPPPHLLVGNHHVTLNWRVKGQVVVPRVGSTRPWIQVPGSAAVWLLLASSSYLA